MKKPHKHSTTYDGKKYTWDVYKLWESSKDLPVNEMPVDKLTILDRNCWFSTAQDATVREVSKHCLKAMQADLSFPVILNVDGTVMDGGHRALKCILNGQETIKYVQFTQMPPADDICDLPKN